MSTHVCPETGLPLGETKPALEVPHFPTRWQVVLWRNWGLVTVARLAAVLRTDAVTLAAAARDLGLGAPASPELEKRWLQRGYITLIRQNWHLLPYPQLLQLIERTPAQMAYALKEDDFLWNKLGGFKPDAAPVAWAPLTPEQKQRTASIRELVNACDPAQPPAERPFDFLKQYGQQQPSASSTARCPNRNSYEFRSEERSHGAEFVRIPEEETSGPRLAKDAHPSKPAASLKLIYSYSAVYGDPLLNAELDPYPDGLLADLAANGINGVWLQGVLYTLVPWFGETPYSEGHATRIVHLNRLVDKAARHGIGVYLYMNEPRAMPPEFFAERPEWRGSLNRSSNLCTLCISHPEVRNALRDGLSDLFRKAPGLAGVFTITMSENLTHCQSKPYGDRFPPCPRCAAKATYAVVAEVNNTIAEGVHSARPEADVIAWDWAWNPEWAANVPSQLRRGIKLMCTSELYLETEMQGIKSRVGDYTISKIGPGFLAEDNWSQARLHGIETLAKVQLNNTWECSSVPYLPVPFLVKQHLRNLEKRGITGLMVGWTLGGYPGGNLELIEREPEEIAHARFGAAAPAVVEAWRRFGEAFTLFPIHGATMLYRGPQNYGPMNPLYAQPTGYRSTMVGFPYDDLAGWRSPLYPEAAFEDQFRQLSEGWRDGLPPLRAAAPLVPESGRAAYEDLLRVAEAAYCHFRSTYLQMRFIRLRDSSHTAEARPQIRAILDEEIELARTLLDIVRRDSRIGFEASNHYYYTQQSLMEKVLNCEHLRRIFR